MTVKDEILRYMTGFLERSNPIFSNMPPCPYARKERMDDKIYFFETQLEAKGPSDSFLDEIRDFDNNEQWSTMLAYAPVQEMDVQECYAFAQSITDALTDIDILAIPLHPDDPFSVQSLRTRQVPCVMMLIQRRAFLANAKKKLLKTKYYTNWADQEERIMTQINEFLLEKDAFFPLLWWTDEVIKEVQAGAPFPEIVISSTVTHLSRNDLHLWMHKWGNHHGWRPLCSFSKWRKIQELNKDSIILATAHGGNESGFTAILDPEKTDVEDRPCGFPNMEQWHNRWDGGSYIWIYEALPSE